jgi:UDP-glucose 4-epimerase
MALFLVTGGCGFIGSNLTHALVRRGDRVRVLDDLSSGRTQNVAALLAGHPGQVELWRGDICDGPLLDRALVGVDYVLHQAAVPSVPWSIERPIECQRINVDGTLQVLDAARRSGRVRRLVFAASCAAYGDLHPDDAKRESDAVAPQSPYAAAKLASEHLGTAYHRAYGLPTVALRYFNVFGPRQDPATQYAAVIPRFVQAALRDVQPTIYGDGLQTRDFCYVDNVVEANLLACSADAARVGGQVINIGCGESSSLLDILGALRSLMEGSDQTGPRLLPNFEPARGGEVRHSRADIRKATQLLGYQPRVGLREGLARTLAWYRALSSETTAYTAGPQGQQGRTPCAA